MDRNMLGAALENVRATTPLVHCITNYVTVNDCANALLACGGSPIMADDIDDAPATTRGVDANPDDAVTEDNLAEVAGVVRELAGKLGCIVAVTGAIDLVATAERAVAVRNGRGIMGKITGTGCMLDTVVAAYVVANPDRALEATVAAVAGWGLAGEVAEGRMGELDGNASFRTYLIDAAYNMTAAQLMAGARIEEL